MQSRSNVDESKQAASNKHEILSMTQTIPNDDKTNDNKITTMDTIFEELIKRGTSHEFLEPLNKHLNIHEYDTDSLVQDIYLEENVNQSLLFRDFIKNIQFYNELNDIIDDVVNKYDDDDGDNNHNDKEQNQCLSIFDMDDALCSYYLSIGRQKHQYYDKNGYGVFNREHGGKSVKEIEGELEKKGNKSRLLHGWGNGLIVPLIDFDDAELEERKHKEEQLKILKNCWSNKYFYGKENVDKLSYDPTCSNLKKCSSINNIMMALRFSTTMISDDDEGRALLYQYLTETNKHLLTDFHHLILNHLSSSDKAMNNRNFSKIHHILSRKIQCQINKCNSFVRNARDRNNEKEKERQKQRNLKHEYYVDLLDNIHCFFLHSYDMGFRVNDTFFNDKAINDIADIDEDDEMKMDGDDIKRMYLDHTMMKLSHYIKQKRQNIKIHRLLQPQNKFNTKIDNKNEEEKEEKKKEEEKADSSNNAVPTYSFGHRYWYWSWYKENDDVDKYNGGEYRDWFIPNYYSNFKNEILKYFEITQFEAIKTKAINALNQSQTLKGIKAKIKWQRKHARPEQDLQHYEIRNNSAITVQHLMAILFYTDYTDQQYEFSKSFRSSTPNESIQRLKDRNSQYHHWSKLLREAVEIYGEYLEYSKIKTFYHGVSYIYFSRFDARFSIPTSTTAQIQVALNFAGNSDGIILELEQNPSGCNLKYFNCSLLSCYGNEDERLFFGGYKSLQFKSIRILKKNGPPQNMKIFMFAMSIFNQIIEGQYVDRGDDNISDRYYRICDGLMKQQNNYPIYINECFKQFANSINTININGEAIYKHTSGFAKYLFSRSCKKNDIYHNNVLSLFKLANCFRNANEIKYDCSKLDDMMFTTITQIDINELMILIEEITNNKFTKNLKTIYVKTYGGINDNTNLKESYFSSLGWDIKWNEERDYYENAKNELTVCRLKKENVFLSNFVEESDISFEMAIKKYVSSSTLISKYLTKSIFNTLKNRKTKNGFDLISALKNYNKYQDGWWCVSTVYEQRWRKDVECRTRNVYDSTKCVKCGSQRISSELTAGIVIDDIESLQIFERLYDPIISDLHNNKTHENISSSLSSSSSSKIVNLSINDMSQIEEISISVYRNIIGFPLSGSSSSELKIEEIMKKVFVSQSFLNSELNGSYHCLSDENSEMVKQFKYLFSNSIHEANGTLKGKGFWINSDQTLIISINNYHHLTITARITSKNRLNAHYNLEDNKYIYKKSSYSSSSANISSLFNKLCVSVNLIEIEIKKIMLPSDNMHNDDEKNVNDNNVFLHHPKYGNITKNMKYLGTSLNAKIHIAINRDSYHWKYFHKLHQVANKYQVKIQKIGSYDAHYPLISVSNKFVMGYNETSIIKTVCDAVNAINETDYKYVYTPNDLDNLIDLDNFGDLDNLIGNLGDIIDEINNLDDLDSNDASNNLTDRIGNIVEQSLDILNQ